MANRATEPSEALVLTPLGFRRLRLSEALQAMLLLLTPYIDMPERFPRIQTFTPLAGAALFVLFVSLRKAGSDSNGAVLAAFDGRIEPPGAGRGGGAIGGFLRTQVHARSRHHHRWRLDPAARSAHGLGESAGPAGYSLIPCAASPSNFSTMTQSRQIPSSLAWRR